VGWVPEGETYGGANAWGGVTVDEQRGWVFAATGSATDDFYGGFRKEQNLFANTVLALDARPASVNGIIRPSATTSGTTTTRQRRSS
jgi:glucose dehydrogenase